MTSRAHTMCSAAFVAALALAHGYAQTTAPPASGEWRHYGGDAGARKYSPLAQITKDTLPRLAVAWQWPSVDNAVVAANPTSRPGGY